MKTSPAITFFYPLWTQHWVKHTLVNICLKSTEILQISKLSSHFTFKQDWKFQSIARDKIAKIQKLDKLENWTNIWKIGKKLEKLEKIEKLKIGQKIGQNR